MVKLKKSNCSNRGGALILAMLALMLITALGLSLSYVSTADVRINNNYEMRLKASALAEAGLNQAIDQMRYLYSNGGDNSFTFVLRGPNNVSSDPGAGTFAYRNPISPDVARSLNVANYTVTGNEAGTLWDPNRAGTYRIIGQNGVKWMLNPGPDGIFGTADDRTYFLNPGPDGVFGTADDMKIPSGITTSANDITIGRFFIKVVNNADDSGGAFSDTDRKVIIRCMAAVSSSFGDTVVSGSNRRNSIAIAEALVKRNGLFNLRAAVEDYSSSLAEVEFEHDVPPTPYITGYVNGNSATPGAILGVGTIFGATNTAYLNGATIGADSDCSGCPSPASQITGSTPAPSIGDITAMLNARGESQMLDPNWWAGIRSFLQSIADVVTTNNTDLATAWAASASSPKIIFHNAPTDSVQIEGGPITGSGVLVINNSTDVQLQHNVTWNGLILIFPSPLEIGEYEYQDKITVNGGLITVPLITSVGGYAFGPSAHDELEGQEPGNPVSIIYSPMNLRFGLSRLPLTRLSYRDIKWEMEN